MAQALTQSDFDTVTGKGVTLVDFWAEWCGPCKMLTPTIDALATEYAGKADIRKVNIDEEPGLAERFDVSSIPTLLVIRDGEITDRFIGVRNKAQLSAAIDAALNG